MLNNFKILTVTHRHTKLGDLANFIIQNAEGDVLVDRLKALKTDLEIEELMYVSTCNRVMYFFYTDKVVDRKFIERFFLSVNPKINTNRAYQKAKFYEGLPAFEHIFEVAASTDSMVVGEREILRQLREGFDFCLKNDLTGDNIRLAFQHTVLVAKDVYANTKIGEKPISVVSLAIQKLLASGLPKEARILMIGAGQTNTLAAKFLKKHEYNNVKVFNRSLKNAQKLAKILTCDSGTLKDLANYEEGFDCLIVCTGATDPIIGEAFYAKLLNGDLNRKFIIDLAIPYNVDEKVVQKFAIDYVEIEGLEALAAQNMAFRKREVLEAKKVVQAKTKEFQNIYQRRQITRALKDVPTEIRAVKQKAMTKVFNKEIEELDEETRQLMERMMTYMEKKCIGIPMKAAQEAVL